MKSIKLYTLLLIYTVFTACSDHSSRDVITIENDLFVKSFLCSQGKADIIRPVYQDKTDKLKLNTESPPYFEFVVNGQLITSGQKLWLFKTMNNRPLKNGGSEYSLEFVGAEGEVKGLELTILQQLFPSSALVREKLILRSNEKKYRLNKKNGSPHFVFPAYGFRLGENEKSESLELRLASWNERLPDFDENKGGNHMYYPVLNRLALGDSSLLKKGPVHILTSDSLSWLTAYEHASQDHTGGMLDEAKTGSGKLINDAMQGTEGVFNFELKDEDFLFLGITVGKKQEQHAVSVKALRGAYFDGEIIQPDNPYESVWTATAFYRNNDLEEGKAILREYLFNQICENPVSRKPEFYYNTWGMQRADPDKPLRGILSYDRIFQEIESAARLGVDIFVLDDGWQQAQGIWTPHTERLPQGLKPIKKKLDEYGIKMGLWFSPMGIDSTTTRYKEHPEWVIKDSEGNPILAQWGHPAFDFVSDFFDLFVQDCINMIDEGCRFMKWDAINTFYSTLAGLHHGSEDISPGERRARYEYLLPIYVVKAMEILTDYEPELVIEIDLTEARRVMMGLAPLSQGKLFFMNNGASWYNDYSSYRTKSMRTIANEYAGLIPLELFTYASYPHNIAGSMKYNLANSLLAGHGFWGDLSLMSKSEKDYIGQQVELSKKVLPIIAETPPIVHGKVGDSPEVYRVINVRESAGQIIAFSGSRSHFAVSQEINPKKLLAVLKHPYRIEDNHLLMDLKFPDKESAKAIFVLPNPESEISVLSSSVALENADLKEISLHYTALDAGEQLIFWPASLGKPVVTGPGLHEFSLQENEAGFLIQVSSTGRKDVVIGTNTSDK